MIKRTTTFKTVASGYIQDAIRMLCLPVTPVLPEYEPPHRIASFLETSLKLINYPGRLQEKKYVIGDLELAASYLREPRVVDATKYVEPRSETLAHHLQKIATSLR